MLLWLWDKIAQFCRSPSSNLSLGNLTSKAHVCFPATTTATDVLPAPKSTGGRFIPISARGEPEQGSANLGHARVTWRWSWVGKDR